MLANFLWLLIISALFLWAESREAQGCKNLSKVEINKGESRSENGLRILVSVFSPTKAGTPIPVETQVVNNGLNEVSIGYDSRDEFQIQIKLTCKDGKAVPFTRYGASLFEPSGPLGLRGGRFSGSYRLKTIKPGGSAKELIPNLALYYDLTLPDDYLLTVTRSVTLGEGKLAKVVNLKAGPIRFTVDNP